MTDNASAATVAEPSRKGKKAPRSPKTPKAKRDMTKREYIWSEMKRTRIGYLMAAPYVIIFTAFTVVPVVLSIVLSFTNFNMLEWPTFVGFDNYIRLLLDDDLFITAFQNTIMFAVAIGPASFILAFLVAWFINELPPKIRALVTFIFYAPSISGNAVSVWGLIFKGDIYGYVNGWLMKAGLITKPIVFFQDTKYIVPLCIIVALWTSLGMSFLSNIAGLQGVSKDLYEAGAIDGIKNRWQEAWYITLPSMRQILLFGAVLAITNSFGFGNIVTALCGNPSTDYVGWTLTHHLSEYMGTRFEFGYASAISVVLFLIMIGANMLVRKMLSKVGE